LANAALAEAVVVTSQLPLMPTAQCDD